jgi:hypothetical protein
MLALFEIAGQLSKAMEHFDPEAMKAQIKAVVDASIEVRERTQRIEDKLDQILAIRNRTMIDVVKSVKAQADTPQDVGERTL